MSFITKNLKKVGIVNAILIAACLVFNGYVFGKYPVLLTSPTYIVTNLFEVISIIYGLIYAISGYKKDSEKYYKGFMIALFIARIIDALSDLYYTYSYGAYYVSYFTTIFKFIIAACISILAFAKDFGKNKSLIVVYTSLICEVIVLVRILTTYSSFLTDIAVAFLCLILACITTIFVEAKYIDKESRGAK